MQHCMAPSGPSTGIAVALLSHLFLCAHCFVEFQFHSFVTLLPLVILYKPFIYTVETVLIHHSILLQRKYTPDF